MRVQLISTLPLFWGLGLQKAAQLPLKNSIVITSLADAALHYFTEKDLRVLQAEKQAQLPLILARFSMLSWNTGYLLLQLSKRVSFLPLTFESIIMAPRLLVLLSFGGIVGGAFITGSVVAILNDRQKAIQNNNVPKLWQRSQQECVDQWLIVSQIVISVALTLFSDSKLQFGAVLASNVYTLYQITNRNWPEIFSKDISALNPADQHLLNEYNRVRKILLDSKTTIEDLVGDACCPEVQYIKADRDDLIPLIDIEKVEEFSTLWDEESINDESIDEIRAMIDPTQAEAFEKLIDTYTDYMESKPAIIANLDQIAVLINPNKIKPLVNPLYHLEIDDVFRELMETKKYWVTYVESDSDSEE